MRVALDGADGLLRLEVADDGPGFDADRLAGSSGLGLPGIREQAELLGGGFEARSTPGQGTAVHVWWSLAGPRPGAGSGTP